MEIIPKFVEVNRDRLNEMQSRFGNTEGNRFYITNNIRKKYLPLNCVDEALSYAQNGWEIYVVDINNRNIYDPKFDDETNKCLEEYFSKSEIC